MDVRVIGLLESSVLALASGGLEIQEAAFEAELDALLAASGMLDRIQMAS